MVFKLYSEVVVFFGVGTEEVYRRPLYGHNLILTHAVGFWIDLEDRTGISLSVNQVIPDTFLLAIQLQVVLFGATLSFMVVKSSLAKMLAEWLFGGV